MATLTKLKKELGIESRRKIKYVIAHTKEHPDFKCKQNKKIKYKYAVFVDAGWEGAMPQIKQSGVIYAGFENNVATSNYPYGDIFIALEDDPELKKQEKEMKKMKKQINERLKKINEIEKLKEMLDA
jgi:hypothetical protein